MNIDIMRKKNVCLHTLIAPHMSDVENEKDANGIMFGHEDSERHLIVARLDTEEAVMQAMNLLTFKTIIHGGERVTNYGVSLGELYVGTNVAHQGLVEVTPTDKNAGSPAFLTNEAEVAALDPENPIKTFAMDDGRATMTRYRPTLENATAVPLIKYGVYYVGLGLGGGHVRSIVRLNADIGVEYGGMNPEGKRPYAKEFNQFEKVIHLGFVTYTQLRNRKGLSLAFMNSKEAFVNMTANEETQSEAADRYDTSLSIAAMKRQVKGVMGGRISVADALDHFLRVKASL